MMIMSARAAVWLRRSRKSSQVLNRCTHPVNSGGGVTVAGPSSKSTVAPRARAAWASAIPILPEDRLPRNRTASIGSCVGPAVISTRGFPGPPAFTLNGPSERWSFCLLLSDNADPPSELFVRMMRLMPRHRSRHGGSGHLLPQRSDRQPQPPYSPAHESTDVSAPRPPPRSPCFLA